MHIMASNISNEKPDRVTGSVVCYDRVNSVLSTIFSIMSDNAFVMFYFVSFECVSRSDLISARVL